MTKCLKGSVSPLPLALIEDPKPFDWHKFMERINQTVQLP